MPSPPTESRLPRILICGSDVASNDSTIPLWEQITIALVKSCPHELQIDVFSRLASERVMLSVKERLSRVSHTINCDSLTTNIRDDHIPLKPHHTHIIFCGLKPHRIIPPEVTAIYISTDTSPPHSEFPFDRLGYKGFTILRENEARKLLKELDPEQTSGSAIATLRARALVRALAAQPQLDVLQGIVIARGPYGLDGCVSSAKVLVPAPFDDDEEVDTDDSEERYEFDIPKPIIECSHVEVRGAYAAFVGRFIASLILASTSKPPVDVYTESQFSLQLERACVAAATTSLTQSRTSLPDSSYSGLPGGAAGSDSELLDLAARIPTVAQLERNMTQYMYCRPMLRPDENQSSKDDCPVKVRISWPAPANSPPSSPIVASALTKHHGAFVGLVHCGATCF
ncbi:hypothetical protein EIP86_009128 [Pleurotus ostreatoroseus]|nr:hypothetical protein EIP86_009128 [Pleurotus ostreatoroseus]